MSHKVKSKKLRIAASSYLNTAPLIWSLSRRKKYSWIELLLDSSPAACSDMLASNAVAVALAPVIDYQRTPGLAILSKACVASRDKVGSVLLLSKKELGDVRSIALDDSSRTSAALVKILFREFLDREPDWNQEIPDIEKMLAAHDAALIIGDPAMAVEREGVIVHDLAALWRQKTGLGFVFALWMGRGDGIAGELDFERVRDEGLSELDQIAAAYSAKLGLTQTEIVEYLTHNIVFQLDDELMRGLELFFSLAYKHRLITEIRPLRFASL